MSSPSLPVSQVILHSYWRSSCSWRVRIALAMKNIEYEYQGVHLVKNGGEQHLEEYRDLNPSELVPTLQIDGLVLSESNAIIEYLEETRKEEGQPLLPSDPVERARVREICSIISCDIQPIQNLRVLQKIAVDCGEDHKISWARYWIELGFEALEKILARNGGIYCVGNTITAADLYLIPQVYNARRFGVLLDRFPTIARIEEECASIPAFQIAHADVQPDAVPSA